MPKQTRKGTEADLNKTAMDITTGDHCEEINNFRSMRHSKKLEAIYKLLLEMKK